MDVVITGINGSETVNEVKNLFIYIYLFIHFFSLFCLPEKTMFEQTQPLKKNNNKKKKTTTLFKTYIFKSLPGGVGEGGGGGCRIALTKTERSKRRETQWIRAV